MLDVQPEGVVMGTVADDEFRWLLAHVPHLTPTLRAINTTSKDIFYRDLNGFVVKINPYLNGPIQGKDQNKLILYFDGRDVTGRIPDQFMKKITIEVRHNQVITIPGIDGCFCDELGYLTGKVYQDPASYKLSSKPTYEWDLNDYEELRRMTGAVVQVIIPNRYSPSNGDFDRYFIVSDMIGDRVIPIDTITSNAIPSDEIIVKVVDSEQGIVIQRFKADTFFYTMDSNHKAEIELAGYKITFFDTKEEARWHLANERHKRLEEEHKKTEELKQVQEELLQTKKEKTIELEYVTKELEAAQARVKVLEEERKQRHDEELRRQEMELSRQQMNQKLSLMQMDIDEKTSLGQLALARENAKVQKAALDVDSAGIGVAGSGIKAASIAVPIVAGLLGAALLSVGLPHASVAGYITSYIPTMMSSAMHTFGNVAASALSVVTEIASTCWNGVKAIASTCWNGVKTVASACWNGVKTVASSIGNGISTCVEGLSSMASSIGGMVASWF